VLFRFAVRRWWGMGDVATEATYRGIDIVVGAAAEGTGTRRGDDRRLACCLPDATEELTTLSPMGQHLCKRYPIPDP